MRLSQIPSVKDVDTEKMEGLVIQKGKVSKEDILAFLLVNPKLGKYINVEGISRVRLRDIFGSVFVFQFEELKMRLKDEQLAFDLLFKLSKLNFSEGNDTEDLKQLLIFLEQQKNIENGNVIMLGEVQSDTLDKILKGVEDNFITDEIYEVKKAVYKIYEKGRNSNPTYQLLNDLIELTSGDIGILRPVIDIIIDEYFNNKKDINDNKVFGRAIIKEFSSLLNGMTIFTNEKINNLSDIRELRGVSVEDLVINIFFILNLRQEQKHNVILTPKVILKFINLKKQYGEDYALLYLKDKGMIKDSFKNIKNINIYREWFTSEIPFDNLNKNKYISRFLYYTQNNEKSLEKIANFISNHGSDSIPVLFRLGSFLKHNLDESLKIVKHILSGGTKEKRSIETLMIESRILRKRSFNLSDEEKKSLDDLEKIINKIKKGKEQKINKLDEIIKELDLKAEGANNDTFKSFKNLFFEDKNSQIKKFGDEKKKDILFVGKFNILNKRYNKLRSQFKKRGILKEDFTKIFKITGGHKKRLNKLLYFVNKCENLKKFLNILDPLNELSALYRYDFDNNINNLRKKLLVLLELKNGHVILSEIIQNKDKINSVGELSRFIESRKRVA